MIRLLSNRRFTTCNVAGTLRVPLIYILHFRTYSLQTDGTRSVPATLTQDLSERLPLFFEQSDNGVHQPGIYAAGRIPTPHVPHKIVDPWRRRGAEEQAQAQENDVPSSIGRFGQKGAGRSYCRGFGHCDR